MKLGYVAGAVIAGALVVGAVAVHHGRNADAGTDATAVGPLKEPPLAVGAADISRAFQADETQAKLDYGDRALKVSGFVVGKNLTVDGRPMITLKGAAERNHLGTDVSGRVANVMLFGIPKEAAAKVTEGKAMSFNCSGANQLFGATQVDDCSIAQ